MKNTLIIFSILLGISPLAKASTDDIVRCVPDLINPDVNVAVVVQENRRNHKLALVETKFFMGGTTKTKYAVEQEPFPVERRGAPTVYSNDEVSLTIHWMTLPNEHGYKAEFETSKTGSWNVRCRGLSRPK